MNSTTKNQLPTKSYFTTERDLEMAFQQTRYTTLTPAEQVTQEKWAQDKLRSIKLCPGGFCWQRIEGGYNCSTGVHYIRDDLLAEGRGGLMTIGYIDHENHRWVGPFYEESRSDREDMEYYQNKELCRRSKLPIWKQQEYLERREALERKRARELEIEKEENWEKSVASDCDRQRELIFALEEKS